MNPQNTFSSDCKPRGSELKAEYRDNFLQDFTYVTNTYSALDFLQKEALTFENGDLKIELDVKEAFLIKGLQPDLCGQHNRVFLFNCLSCPGESKKLCYYCYVEQKVQHQGHEVRVIQGPEDYGSKKKNFDFSKTLEDD